MLVHFPYSVWVFLWFNLRTSRLTSMRRFQAPMRTYPACPIFCLYSRELPNGTHQPAFVQYLVLHSEDRRHDGEDDESTDRER